MEVCALKTNLSDSRGFTFVEVLVSITILAFVIVGVLMMSSMQIKTNSFSQHHSKAIELAEDGLEMLNRVDYNTLLAPFNGTIEEYGTIPNFLEFRRTYEVNWNTDLSTIRVTVQWRSLARNSAPVVLTMLRVRTL